MRFLLADLLVYTTALLATNLGGCCARTNFLEADFGTTAGSHIYA
jgi:hypothetical protein